MADNTGYPGGYPGYGGGSSFAVLFLIILLLFAFGIAAYRPPYGY